MSELAPIAFTREHSEWDDFDRHARPRLRARFGFVASRGLDPDDVTQETLIAARSRFRPLEPFAVMYAWCRRHGLYVVMSSGARGYGRYERPCDDLATVVPITAAAPGPEAEVVDRLLVRAVLDRLDPNDREVLLLDQRDLSAEQMAAVLGTTAGAARVRLSRARSRFRAAVGDVRPVLPALANGRLARWYRGRAAHAHDLAEAVTRAAIVAPAATAAAVTFAATLLGGAVLSVHGPAAAIRPAAAARPAPARPGEDRQPGLASPPSPARRGVAPALPRRPLVVIGPLPDPPRAPGERCFRRRVCVHPPDVHHGPGDSLYLKPLGDYSATPEEEVVPVCDAVTDNAVVGCERDEPDHYVVDPSRGMP